MRKLFICVAVFGFAVVLAGGPVAAQQGQSSSGSFLNAGGVPQGSVLVLNITFKVTNDEDSGYFGYWALDDYNKQVQVWQIRDGSFYAVVRYTGKWQGFAGAPSPGAGTRESKDASGTFEGGYIATFTATGFTPGYGHIGTFDFGGTEADVLSGTNIITPFDWVSTYFQGVGNFAQPNWGWTYRYRSQTWNNFSSGSTGDLVF